MKATAAGTFDTGSYGIHAASGAAGLHSWFTGLKMGNQMNHLLLELEHTKAEVERLTAINAERVAGISSKPHGSIHLADLQGRKLTLAVDSAGEISTPPR